MRVDEAVSASQMAPSVAARTVAAESASCRPAGLHQEAPLSGAVECCSPA